MTPNATCIRVYDVPLFWGLSQRSRKQLRKDWPFPVSLTSVCLQGSAAGSAPRLAGTEEEQKSIKPPAAVPPQAELAEPVSGI